MGVIVLTELRVVAADIWHIRNWMSTQEPFIQLLLVWAAREIITKLEVMAA